MRIRLKRTRRRTRVSRAFQSDWISNASGNGDRQLEERKLASITRNDNVGNPGVWAGAWNLIEPWVPNADHSFGTQTAQDDGYDTQDYTQLSPTNVETIANVHTGVASTISDNSGVGATSISATVDILSQMNAHGDPNATANLATLATVVSNAGGFQAYTVGDGVNPETVSGSLSIVYQGPVSQGIANIAPGQFFTSAFAAAGLDQNGLWVSGLDVSGNWVTIHATVDPLTGSQAATINFTGVTTTELINYNIWFRADAGGFNADPNVTYSSYTDGARFDLNFEEHTVT
ncbi:hypothetical protein [Paludisphaera rhizosphaerae]|nr:hypothetical protein [Paludisphaera rhizosphaerae]